MSEADDLVTITVSRADVERVCCPATCTCGACDAARRLLAALPPKPEPEWEPSEELVGALMTSVDRHRGDDRLALARCILRDLHRAGLLREDHS